MNKTVIILRGVSGSGKSTFANLIAEPKVVCTADDFFEKNGKYEFDVTKLGQAHNECQNKFLKALLDTKTQNIVVANTNTSRSDFKFYEGAATQAGVQIVFAVLEKRHPNKDVHNVPDEILGKQHDALKQSIKLR